MSLEILSTFACETVQKFSFPKQNITIKNIKFWRKNLQPPYFFTSPACSLSLFVLPLSRLVLCVRRLLSAITLLHLLMIERSRCGKRLLGKLTKCPTIPTRQVLALSGLCVWRLDQFIYIFLLFALFSFYPFCLPFDFQ